MANYQRTQPRTLAKIGYNHEIFFACRGHDFNFHPHWFYVSGNFPPILILLTHVRRAELLRFGLYTMK